MEFATPSIAASAAASFVLAGGLALTSAAHGRFSFDLPGAVQKFHDRPTPRVGGIGIYLALLAALPLVADAAAAAILGTILIAGIPALLVGLLEDVTKRVGAPARLLATWASGLLACWIGGVYLWRIDVPYFDSALAFAPFAIPFTAFALAGISNAINIIDGFHGLASGTAALALACLAAVAASAGDTSLLLAAVVLAAALGGFWLVNFPWGKLFLGDGGAYFAGFALGYIAVLLPMRNPGVSPWASLLICAYPVIEVLYSIARRWRLRQSPGHADRGHLHSMVASRFVLPRLRWLPPTLQNAAVSVLMWMCAAVPALAGVTFHDRPGVLAAGVVACVLLYHCLYRKVARS